jgi:hypothetical protein
MLLTDSGCSVSAVGKRDMSPMGIPSRNRVTMPLAAVVPGVHTPYDYDQRI